MNKLISSNIVNIMFSVLIMVVGILFCCSLAIVIDGLSVIIGLILLLIGIVYLVNSMFSTQGVVSGRGISGCLIVSLAVIFMVHKLAALVFVYIPWLLMIGGVVLLLDAFAGKFLKEESGYFNFIVKLVKRRCSLKCCFGIREMYIRSACSSC